MNSQDYWLKKHTKYLSEDWITKPTIFATEIVQYLPKSGKLLELGCGQGQDSKYFTDLCYEVTATDFSQFALDQIKDSRIDIKILDLKNRLPLDKESFDIVYCHLGMGYFTDNQTQKIFDEVYSVLKPRGIFAGLFNSTDDPETKIGVFLEEDYYLVDEIKKRYFSIDSVKNYAKQFDLLLLDNYGTTHKDNIKGVKNLIRFVGRK
jgi:SAM-dependent methyltransferase